MPKISKTLPKQIWARVRIDELVALDTAANQVGKSRSAFIRYCVLYTLQALKRTTPPSTTK